MDLHQRQLRSMHLFAGAGGGILADLLLGHRPVCAVEIEEYPRRVLIQRQLDGCLPRFPIWDDVTTFDGRPWRGKVDIIAGGFPCQDISSIGKGAGIEGSQSGLWSHMSRIIGEVRPRKVFVENSPELVSRGLDRVLSDLASMGYHAKWCRIGSDATGNDHKRWRFWMVAYSTEKPMLQASSEIMPPGAERLARGWITGDYRRALSGAEGASPECLVLRDVDELAYSVDPYKALGNGQDPTVAALAWRILTDGLEFPE